ncbi:MAG: NADPH-dependent curcumin reductase [Alphaproteobacteria bacterium]|nr:NADPH-dependent curcumin reductase [Alphaproteobacteria bacterium]
MRNISNRQIVLAARPSGAPKDSDFRFDESPVPTPGPGQMLCRVIYLSLDPYVRGRMNDGPSYAAPVQIDGVITGRTVSQVMESNLAGYAPGDFVFCDTVGWQEYGLIDGTALGLRKLDPKQAPISAALGVLGMPGFTAWYGLLELGTPKAGETVVVSAATGAVGSLAGQIAKIKGCRTIGIAGAAEKCAFAVEALGYDACISHLSGNLAAELRAACPKGIDVYFENVGGKVFDAVFPQMNNFSRLVLCGGISGYNATALPQGPDRTSMVMMSMIGRRMKASGFVIGDHRDRFDEFQNEVSGWLREGKVRHREDITQGLENAVKAFQGLLEGRNFGKQLVQISDDPTR